VQTEIGRGITGFRAIMFHARSFRAARAKTSIRQIQNIMIRLSGSTFFAICVRGVSGDLTVLS